MLDHDAPPSNETQAPPSFPWISRCGLRGSIQRSWLSPCGVGMAAKVLPPSVERQLRTFGAQTVSGSWGSAMTWA